MAAAARRALPRLLPASPVEAPRGPDPLLAFVDSPAERARLPPSGGLPPPVVERAAPCRPRRRTPPGHEQSEDAACGTLVRAAGSPPPPSPAPCNPVSTTPPPGWGSVSSSRCWIPPSRSGDGEMCPPSEPCVSSHCGIVRPHVVFASAVCLGLLFVRRITRSIAGARRQPPTNPHSRTGL